MQMKWFGKQVLAEVQVRQGQAMDNACQFLTEQVKDSMKAGTGRMWPSKVPGGGMHQASVPGVPPAPDTQELKDSISWASSTGNKGGGDSGISNPVYGMGTGIIAGKVGTTNFKGWFHEMGWTVDGAARPFLRPALANNTKQILDILSRGKL